MNLRTLKHRHGAARRGGRVAGVAALRLNGWLFKEIQMCMTFLNLSKAKRGVIFLFLVLKLRPEKLFLKQIKLLLTSGKIFAPPFKRR